MNKAILVSIFFCTTLISFAQKSSKKDQVITMETNKGTIVMILFDETPKHKANFLKLANQGFYDSTLFHRVIKEFMIQGGDPTSKNASQTALIGNGGSELKNIPFEFTTKHVHTKGALAAARDNNPAKSSSGCQFYIVTGKKYNTKQLASFEERMKIKYTDEQLKAYEELGGTPFLDKNYTVFGTVISGIDVVEKIEIVGTRSNDRPVADVIILSTEVKNVSKKKISKQYNYTYL